ncbi:MAG: hypothetical protein D6782_05985 [Alphaproteobacteria bacterium]|nr:MAG: hypothetical protein D6782_05985 [Alphaproteobacteria bacterium]
MTTADNPADPAIPADLLTEVLEAVEDRLDGLALLLADIGADRLAPDTGLRRFLGEVHSMKGTVRAFGFGHLAALCHRLEDALAGRAAFDDGLLARAAAFVQGLQAAQEDGRLDDAAALDRLAKRLELG